jgi:hypothetical protein
MTQAGGKAGRRELRDNSGKVVRTEYEIAVSTTLLFQTFQEDHRPVVMSGIECRDRLAALQRVMEHEMTYLVEMLIWVTSSCAAPRFHFLTSDTRFHVVFLALLMSPSAWSNASRN